MKQLNFKLMLIIFMNMVGIDVMAYDVDVDGICYNLSGTEATVTYTRKPYNQYNGEIIIPSSFEYNSQTYSVTSIGDDAFSYCSLLTSVIIPSSVTSIGGAAFEGCSGLTSIDIPNSVTSIGYLAFKSCTGLTSITIPNSVTTIDSQTFYYCTGLTSVTIGNNVTTIGRHAFANCSSLTFVTIPNSVTSVGDNAFYECTGLNSVTIGNSVTSIGDYAFSGCSGLKGIRCYATNPPMAGFNFLYGVIYDCTIDVLKECVDTYKAATSWSGRATYIKAMPNPSWLYPKSVEGDYWSTYYNDNANVQVDANTTVYKVALDGEVITLTDTGSKIIKAGEAVVLSSTASGISLTYTSTETTGDYTGNALLGSNAEVAQESGYTYYALANLTNGLGFYKLGSGVSIPANKAYIKVASSSGARSFYGLDGDNATGINNISVSEENKEYYDLNGRRVIQPTKGLYIVNGKKVVIK